MSDMATSCSSLLKPETPRTSASPTAPLPVTLLTPRPITVFSSTPGVMCIKMSNCSLCQLQCSVNSPIWAYSWHRIKCAQSSL